MNIELIKGIIWVLLEFILVIIGFFLILSGIVMFAVLYTSLPPWLTHYEGYSYLKSFLVCFIGLSFTTILILIFSDRVNDRMEKK